VAAKIKYGEWRKLIANAPRMAGVYEVWAGHVCLYVGQGRCIYSRLLHHDRRDEFTASGADLIRWTVIEGVDAVRRSLEAVLTTEYRPQLLGRSKVWSKYIPDWPDQYAYVAPPWHTFETLGLRLPIRCSARKAFIERVWARPRLGLVDVGRRFVEKGR
jgi:hypothetical protein